MTCTTFMLGLIDYLDLHVAVLYMRYACSCRAHDLNHEQLTFCENIVCCVTMKVLSDNEGIFLKKCGWSNAQHNTATTTDYCQYAHGLEALTQVDIDLLDLAKHVSRKCRTNASITHMKLCMSVDKNSHALCVPSLAALCKLHAIRLNEESSVQRCPKMLLGRHLSTAPHPLLTRIAEP
jgi:hypothetical protein